MGSVCGPAGCCAGCCGAGISFSPLVLSPELNRGCCAECCISCRSCCNDDVYSCQGCCSDCYGDMCVRKGWFAQICQDFEKGGGCQGCCGTKSGQTCCRGCDTCWSCSGQGPVYQNQPPPVPLPISGVIYPSSPIISPYSSPSLNLIQPYPQIVRYGGGTLNTGPPVIAQRVPIIVPNSPRPVLLTGFPPVVNSAPIMSAPPKVLSGPVVIGRHL